MRCGRPRPLPTPRGRPFPQWRQNWQHGGQCGRLTGPARRASPRKTVRRWSGRGKELAMKPSRAFGPLPHLRYRPEVTHCLHCGAALQYSHSMWAKPIQFLTGPAHVTNLGFRCSNAACAFGRSVYRSARAEARQVKGSGYGLDVVVRIGYLRFGEHRTREEIWREFGEQTPVQLSERHVQNLLEVYLALLRASEADPRERLAATVEMHGGIILALDGLQPEQGNEQLWVVREVLSGAVLGAANLQQATAAHLARLLRPIRATGLPVLGVVSDAQESIHLAVAEVFPQVPHQLCQYHALREAAEPLWEADRHLLVQAKKELRGLRDVEERTRGGAGYRPRVAASSAGARPAALRLRRTARPGCVRGRGRDAGPVPAQKGDARLARLRTLVRRAEQR